MAGDGKPGSKASPQGASSSGTLSAPLAPRDLPTRSDLAALITGSNGLVNDSSDARNWLESKGWILLEEKFSLGKLISILLTVSLLPKIPVEIATAVRSTAFLAQDKLEDDLSTSLVSSIAEKLTAQFGNVPEELKKAKEFLEATSTQQASGILGLQETTAQQAATTANLVEVSAKLAEAPRPTNAGTPLWPSLPSAASLPPVSHDPSQSANEVRVQQRLLLASRTVLIEVDHSSRSAPKDRLSKATASLRDTLNKCLQELDSDNADLSDTTDVKTKIHGIQSLERGAYLVKLDSPASATCFRSYCTDFDLLTAHLGLSASIKSKAFNLVFRFIPCDGAFDPSDQEHIAAIELDNNLTLGSISSASWLKRPERRSPNQKVASLRVACTSPEAANHLLRERVYVEGVVVDIRKDLREPIRCNKCQLFGHIRSSCISDERCTHCASGSHVTSDCRPNQALCCVS